MTLQELQDAAFDGSISPNDFLKELGQLSTGHKRLARQYSLGDVVLYRTRVFDQDIRPLKVAELSYPPVKFCKLQRASGIGEQVFYASAGMPTTLAESRVAASQFLIVSKWKNTRDLILQEVGLNTGSQEIEQLYHNIFTSREEAIYPYSSKIANHLIGSDPIGGLLYPSIINQNQSHNVVLKKEFVDSGLRFVNAVFYNVNSISNDNKFEVDEVDFATSSDGISVDWKGRKKEWPLKNQGDEVKMVSNGWDWEAYTVDGHYIEPE